MSTLLKCRKILKSGKQCSRNAQFNSDYCWQHLEQKSEISPSTFFKEISQLPADISKNILSDYIDYDTLSEITKYSNDFKVNPNRIRIKEEINKNKDIIKEIYIDDDLRKKETFNKNNIKIAEENRKNGAKEGKQYVWYENGQLAQESNYKNGKLEGKYYLWYENGQLAYEHNYKDNKREGKIYSWYENGQLQSEGNFKNDEKEGKQYVWYENGQLAQENNYKNGQREGKQYYWYKNGQLEYEANCKNGQLEYGTNYKDDIRIKK
jgi:antitoxin component YwqK of YwqJK toxin-antitoxin module